jgi:hypothetical protein
MTSRFDYENGQVFGRLCPALQRIAFRISLCLLFISTLLCVQAFAETKRLIIIKCDGLPYDLVDRLVKERDPRTGKSLLPWTEFIFYQNGARLSNFYVRGMSLSAPSWSLIETGQHLQIKGNVEFDRYTLHSYDYLNFIPYLINGALGARIDMPAVEVLDSLGIPLIVDAYPNSERYASYSLYQRGTPFATLQGSLQNRFKRAPKQLFDEWTMGFDMRSALPEQVVRELIQRLSNPKVRYLDMMLVDFDHVGHHNNDLQSQLYVLKQMDDTFGQIWSAIQKAPLADETAFVIVSDHGFNSDEKIYSQGYNLVKLLGSREGGGHHVITKRRLMLDYSIKGVNPLVPLITTTTDDTYYLRGQSTVYPTAMLDFDGNERASIHFRESDLNLLHILLQQLQRPDLRDDVRKAATRAFFATIERHRNEWQSNISELNEELEALARKVEVLRKLWLAQPKKFSRQDKEAGRDDDAKRIFVDFDRSQNQLKEYQLYTATMQRLLSLEPNTLSPIRMKIEDVIPKMSMGEPNSIYELQNYIVGPGNAGLVMGSDGSLDMDRSFLKRNYFQLLHGVTVRNNVQPGIGNRPIDMIATRISAAQVLPLLPDKEIADDVIWISTARDKQALLLSRMNAEGQLSLRYQPIANLTEDQDGRMKFDLIDWQSGLPLKIFEDPNLTVPGDRKQWLGEWHTDLEWLRAVHRTKYSNGIVGLHEELARHSLERLTPESGITPDDSLLRRLARRQRELVEADMLIIANDHWNFDVRGFNPGGNHGSFFRISTHSVFMVAGGKSTNIPAGITITEPYDSLSFVPTLLALTGELRDDSRPIPILWDKGFRRFPGRVVKELLPDGVNKPKIAITGASSSP